MHWRVPDEVCEPYFLVGPRSTRSYAVTCWGLSPLFPQPVSSWITLRSTGQGQGYFNSIHHLLTELLTNTPSCKKKKQSEVTAPAPNLTPHPGRCHPRPTERAPPSVSVRTRSHTGQRAAAQASWDTGATTWPQVLKSDTSQNGFPASCTSKS